jgi:cytidine deaminase
MDDRNLVAVAEQAAATSKVLRGAREGATAKFEDGRVFLGCKMEFADPSLDLDAISAAVLAGRVQGGRRVSRIGLYSPLNDGLPAVSAATLRRLREVGAPGLTIILSNGAGLRTDRSLSDLLAAAGIAELRAT